MRLEVCQGLRAGLLLQGTGHHLIGVRVRIQVVTGGGDHLAHRAGDLAGHAGIFGRGRRRGGHQRRRDGAAQDDGQGGHGAPPQHTAALGGGMGAVHELSSRRAGFLIRADGPYRSPPDARSGAPAMPPGNDRGSIGGLSAHPDSNHHPSPLQRRSPLVTE
ncbi:hypothetical protein MHIB_33380 [Mycolicibacter hiberniae]|uniref:Uncharacterized protein n=1 Tax=Mycolicibacter hiberniae TaxID=29314 RepID=A0A7I7X6C5_9MYCO|nr:hypothetical protein MHIB_33380 [Mycolicibacter hiberniae]